MARENGAARVLPARHKSRSEEDWRNVMQALERREDPASIVCRLEEARKDKPSPHAYAMRTVRKAQRILEHGNGRGIEARFCPRMFVILARPLIRRQ